MFLYIHVVLQNGQRSERNKGDFFLLIKLEVG